MSDQHETIVETVNGAEAPAVPGIRGDAGYGADAREPGAGQLLLWLHLMLRGRYPLLIILSLVLGGAMGYGGFRLGYKTFRSTSLIQIVTPLKLTKGSEDENATDTDGFVSTQAALLKSQRVMDMAMQNADWQALHRPVTETSTEEFAQMLSVMPKDRMIYVSFEDHDPKAAVVALKSVIEAYSRLYVEEEARKKAHRLQVLRDQEISLGNDDSTYKGQIDAITAKWGTSDLASLAVAKRASRDRLDDLRQEIEMRLALAPSASTTRPAAEEAKQWAAVLERYDVEDLALGDRNLREALNERFNLEKELRKLTTVHGYGETHPRVLETKKALEQVELDVTAHTARARERLKKAPSAVANITDPAELRMKAAKVLEMYTAAEKAATQIGQESLRLASLQEKREEVRQTLEPLRSWLRDLNLKEAEGSRIKINDGLTAASAQTDTRVRFTALGAMLGLMTAFGIVLLPSVMDRRFRAADETKVANYLGPVLGVLPELPGDLADDEHAAMAAHCVHQTRTILQMRHEGADGQVLAVTSSLAGTGKTSLTMALGVSFATSGSRTLMIDCDLVGGGLSARISRIMRRKIGHLLVRDGLVSEQQLEQALSESRRTGRPLGETCVTLGFTGELDVQRALASQEGEHMGVLEALAGESLQDCVAQTGFPGLSILPLGTASARHCASISPAALRRLVKSARGQFDTVLIDTGPVPGSLEASVVVPEVDGVVLVVSKGEHRPSVARSAEYLRSMNAVPVGVVFNRASVKEVSHNSSTLHRSTAAFGSSSGMGLRIDAEQSRRSSRLGPMAQAVAGCAPPDAEEGTNR